MNRTKIFDRDWKVYLHSADKFCKKFGEGDAAVTLPGLAEMHFSEEELNLVVVLHECVHAYYDSMNVSSAKLTLDQQEEVFAELFANSGSTMIKHAKRLLKGLKRERD